MSGKKKSWYAVRKGRKTGLYTEWEECRKQVIGCQGAVYKGFYTKEEAEAYLKGSTAAAPQKMPAQRREETVDPAVMTVYVDGSYAPFLPDRYAFGVVFLYEGRIEKAAQCCVDPENASMRNVAGEVAGARYAMARCVERGITEMALYYDYAGIEKWCTGEWKANKPGTKALKAYYESIRGNLHVTFHKVKSHTGVKYNEMVDQLAKAALFSHGE